MADVETVVAAGAVIVLAIEVVNAVAVAVEAVVVVVEDAPGLRRLRARKALMLSEPNVADIAKDTREKLAKRHTRWTVMMEQAEDVAVTEKAELARVTGVIGASLTSMPARTSGRKDPAESVASVGSPKKGMALARWKRRSTSQWSRKRKLDSPWTTT